MTFCRSIIVQAFLILFHLVSREAYFIPPKYHSKFQPSNKIIHNSQRESTDQTHRANSLTWHKFSFENSYKNKENEYSQQSNQNNVRRRRSNRRMSGTDSSDLELQSSGPSSSIFYPCVPRTGHTAIIIGQDLDSIRNYTLAFPQHSFPFGVMSYTALIGPHGSLAGLAHPIDYGSGIEYASGLINTYKKHATSLQLGLWLVDQLPQVLAGELNTTLDSLSKWVKSILPCAVYIRIGYEFDSSENNYEPEQYVNAFRFIVDYIRAKDVSNVAFVWHASGFEPRDHRLVEDWFPGRNYTDWCGISLFQQPYNCSLPEADYHTCMPHVESLAEFCSKHRLPLMIAESAPYGGIVPETSSFSNFTNSAGFAAPSWHYWFEPVLAFIHRRDVRIWSYINTNWDSLPMWRVNHAPGEPWGDSRVQVFNDIKEHWIGDSVLQSNRMLLAYDAAMKKNKCDHFNSSSTSKKNQSNSKKKKNSHHYSKFEYFLRLYTVRLIEIVEVAILLGFFVGLARVSYSCAVKGLSVRGRRVVRRGRFDPSMAHIPYQPISNE